jgi:hypothetical protein
MALFPLRYPRHLFVYPGAQLARLGLLKSLLPLKKPDRYR